MTKDLITKRLIMECLNVTKDYIKTLELEEDIKWKIIGSINYLQPVIYEKIQNMKKLIDEEKSNNEIYKKICPKDNEWLQQQAKQQKLI